MIPAPGLLVTEGLRLERLLGAGGMGSVWLARRADSAEVAVKLVADEIAADPEIRERFLREALAAARLSGPSVVNVLDYGAAPDGTPYLVMELCRGETLRHRMERAPVGLGEAAHIVAGVASALAFAHAAGIVHRDVKPDNVFLEPGGVKLGDFGIAKHALARGQTLTATGSVMGTPAYMSPEQILFTGGRDPGCDLWATAVLAYELVVGRRPFDGEGLAAIARAVCSGRFALPSSFGLPAACDAFFARAFALDAAARFASAPELAQAFRAAAGLAPDLVVPARTGARPDDPTAVGRPPTARQVSTPGHAHAATELTPTAARAPARSSPRRWALAALGALAAAGGGVAIALAMRAGSHGGPAGPGAATALPTASTATVPPRASTGPPSGVVATSLPTASGVLADDPHAIRLDQHPEAAVGRWTTGGDGGEDLELEIELHAGKLRVVEWKLGGATLSTASADGPAPLTVGAPKLQRTLLCSGVIDGELRCMDMGREQGTLHLARPGTAVRPRDACERAFLCATLGHCTRSSVLATCTATRTADCVASQDCAVNGACEARGSRCWATLPAHCLDSTYCAGGGRCTLADGTCVVGSDADCARSTLCARERKCVRLATGVCGKLPERP
ncbi:MAG: protein kinase [Polyangiaceae bacterium]|nr:protein kinase [Polyangiaceae bacterium]